MPLSRHSGSLPPGGHRHPRPKCELPLSRQLPTPVLPDTNPRTHPHEPQQEHSTHRRGNNKQIHVVFLPNQQTIFFQFSYYGEGLDKGQCGVTINSVEDKYNGVVRCFLGLPSEVQEPSGAFLLTVASTFAFLRSKTVLLTKFFCRDTKASAIVLKRRH